MSLVDLLLHLLTVSPVSVSRADERLTIAVEDFRRLTFLLYWLPLSFFARLFQSAALEPGNLHQKHHQNSRPP
jgi:hypothetical protein